MTNRLIEYKIFRGSYQVNSPRLEKYLRDLSTRMGIKKYKLYQIACEKYRKCPWLYDMKGGETILGVKTLFAGMQYTRIPLSNQVLYTLFHDFCSQGDYNYRLDRWVEHKWVAYPHLLEDAYVRAYAKAYHMGYFYKDSLWGNPETIGDYDNPIKDLLKDFLRFTYFATWAITIQNEETIRWWTKVIHEILGTDFHEDLRIQAVNTVNRELQEMAQEEPYKSTPIIYY